MTCYYNDIDPFVCQWLRNLIAAGHLPVGEVDERPIQAVQPDDVRGFTQCHFFAGIGGWAYALQLAEWGDRPVWTGSCPCQPFSATGSRRSHADERHLWPAWFRLIRECRPDTIVGEQVSGAAGLGWLDAVALDLEAADYAVGACVLGAHSVGAPHLRQRLWFVGDAKRPRLERRSRMQRRHRIASRAAGLVGVVDDAPGARRDGTGEGAWDECDQLPCRDGKARPVEPGTFPLASGLPQSLGRLSDLERSALTEIEQYATSVRTDSAEVLRMVWASVRAEAVQWAAGGSRSLRAPEVLLAFLLSLKSARQTSADGGGIKKESRKTHQRAMRSLRWDGRTFQPPRQRRSYGQPGRESSDALFALSLVLARHADAYRTAAREAYAATHRVGRLRAYGNAIVPQVAAAFVRAYLECQP